MAECCHRHAHPATPPLKQTGVGLYTCPMHPEIVRSAPGSCPKCGMALEPVLPTAGEDDSEYRSMIWRFWVGTALTLPLMLLAMRGLWRGGMVWLPYNWLEFALATPLVLWGGWPFFLRGMQSLANRSLNMFTLIALGVAVAYGYSVLATLAPGIFPASM